jgi:antirestriction protein ArdC
VAGFRAWLGLNRCVQKGERGLRILAPMSVKERDGTGEETGERRTLFREAAVFDVSQTEPLPDREPVALGPPGAEIEGDSHAGLLPALEGLAEEIGYAVSYVEELAGAAGVCNRLERTIRVRTAMAANRTVAVLIHELAHALVAEALERGLPYALEEVVAESVAYVASATAGLDVGCEAVPYVAGYGGDDALGVLERSAGIIDSVARRIEQALEPVSERQAA